MSGFPPPPNYHRDPRMGVPPPPPPGNPGTMAPVAQGGFHRAPAVGTSFMPPPAAGGVSQLSSGMGGMSLQRNMAPFQPGAPAPPPGGLLGPPQPPPPGRPQPVGQTQNHFQPPGVPGGFMNVGPPPPGNSRAPTGGVQHHAPSFQQPMPGDAANQNNLNQPTSANFYQQAPTGNDMDRMAAPQPSALGAPGAQGAMQGTMPGDHDNIDYNVKVPEHIMKFTAGKIPQTATIATASKIPFGAILRPLAPVGRDDEEVGTVQPGSSGIIRCKRCRTYINAFVAWSEHGRRWHCNICGQGNDCPAAYFCHLDDHGLRRDRLERPELSKGVVEFIAPAEYMVRPPQAPSYFFVIDVSATSIRSGLLQSVSNAIKKSLYNLPGRERTQIGFITFDSSVHYYNLSSDLANPQMLVVSDLKELFVPLPDNLLVNLEESRSVVESFLDSLPEMFAKNPVVSQSCLGPALKAAFTVMKQIGGKMCVFQSIAPNLGDGALKPRENRGLMGTPNEVKLLRSEVPWYKDTAIEFSRQQISVDMFLFPYNYMDLAALSELPKHTAGSLHSYVSFNHQRDGERFEQQLHKTLTQTTAFEAVMRVRCTKGMRITNFYGNFYVRGTDLLALPNCNSDSVFGFDLAHDEQNVTNAYVTIQAALLYTSSNGERRIRVLTQALPVTSLVSEVISSLDTDVMCNLLAKQAVEISLKSGLDNARLRLQQTCVEIIRTAKGGDKRTVSGYAVPPAQSGQVEAEENAIPENLQLLPLYTLAMMKNVAFRGGTDVHPDERVQAHKLLSNMWVSKSKHFIYPRMFSLHDLGLNAGLPSEDNSVASSVLTAGRRNIVLPSVVNLSVDRLSSEGVYVLDNGMDIYFWIGRAANVEILGSLFGMHSLDDVDLNQLKLITNGDQFSSKVGSILTALREDEADPFFVDSKINIIREGDAHMEARFFWFLVEDRASFQGGTFSYSDFMQFVTKPTQGGPGGGSGMPPGPGGMPPGPRGMPGPQPPGRGGSAPPPPHGNMGVRPSMPVPSGLRELSGPPNIGMPRGAPNAGMPPGPPNPANAGTPALSNPGYAPNSGVAPPNFGGPPGAASWSASGSRNFPTPSGYPAQNGFGAPPAQSAPQANQVSSAPSPPGNRMPMSHPPAKNFGMPPPASSAGLPPAPNASSRPPAPMPPGPETNRGFNAPPPAYVTNPPTQVSRRQPSSGGMAPPPPPGGMPPPSSHLPPVGRSPPSFQQSSNPPSQPMPPPGPGRGVMLPPRQYS